MKRNVMSILSLRLPESLHKQLEARLHKKLNQQNRGRLE